MHESLKDKNYFGKKISVNFFAPKSGYRHEKQPVLGPDIIYIYTYLIQKEKMNNCILQFLNYETKTFLVLQNIFYSHLMTVFSTVLNSEWRCTKCVN